MLIEGVEDGLGRSPPIGRPSGALSFVEGLGVPYRVVGKLEFTPSRFPPPIIGVCIVAGADVLFGRGRRTEEAEGSVSSLL